MPDGKIRSVILPGWHIRLKYGIVDTYVFFASRSQFLLSKFECFHDSALADVLNKSLLLQVEKQLGVGIQDLLYSKIKHVPGG